MKLFSHCLLLTLLVCSLSTLAAAEPAPAVEAKPVAPQAAPPSSENKPPSLLPAAPLNAGITKTASDASPSPQAMRMGHIDLARVNTESDSGKAGQTRLEEKKKKLQAQIETKRKQIEKLKTSIEAKLQSLTPPQREAKAKEFQKKVDEFQKFGQNSENELQTMQQEIIGALYEKVEQACSVYAKANNLALIVIKRELLYLASGVEVTDVTDGVIKLLNQGEPKK
jgi:outer membrane protein